MRSTAWFITVVLLTAPTAPSPQQSPIDRVIEENLTVQTPLRPCRVPALAFLLARSLRVAVGIESVPEDCSGARQPGVRVPDDVVLTGLTVGDALNRLIQLDPRYTWTEADSVIVIRPIDAWQDRSHFLHQTFPVFRVEDERLPRALYVIQRALSGDPLHGPYNVAAMTANEDRRLTVHLNAASALDALNATVRAHGGSGWWVRYCQPAARYEFATLRFFTFDDGGIGSHANTRREDGSSFDACRQPR